LRLDLGLGGNDLGLDLDLINI